MKKKYCKKSVWLQNCLMKSILLIFFYLVVSQNLSSGIQKKKIKLQGVPLKWPPPLNFLSTKSICNLWHFEKFGASLHGILYLENLGGGATLAEHPVAPTNLELNKKKNTFFLFIFSKHNFFSF